jgi:RNA recognition motif-containing protein
MSSEKVLSAETRPSPADDNNESECKGNSGSSHDSLTGSKSSSNRRTRLFIRDLPGDTSEDFIKREVEE